MRYLLVGMYIHHMITFLDWKIALQMEGYNKYVENPFRANIGSGKKRRLEMERGVEVPYDFTSKVRLDAILFARYYLYIIIIIIIIIIAVIILQTKMLIIEETA